MLLVTLAANILAASRVAGWLHPDMAEVLEQMGPIASCAYTWWGALQVCIEYSA